MSLNLSLLNQKTKTLVDHGDATQSDIALISDFEGSLLHATSSRMGRTWRALYTVLQTVSNEPCISFDKLKNNFVNLRLLFRKVIDEMRLLSEAKSRCQGDTEQTKEALYRRKIIDLAEALPSLFDLCIPFSGLSGLEKIQFLSQKLLGEKLLTLDEERAVHRFERSYAMCALEGCLQTPMPVDELTRLCLRRKLSQEEEKVLSSWIQKIRENDIKITPWLVHKALSGVIECISLKKVFALELALIERKCTLFKKSDTMYRKWLESILPRQKIAGISLGKNIHHPSFRNLGFTLFEHEGHESEMVLFGNSVAKLGIWQASCEESAWAVPCVKVKKIDAEGRFLIVEKVTCSLNQIEWKSQSTQVLGTDLDKCDEIARLLAWMISQPLSPSHLSADFIFFNQEGELRSLIPFQPHSLYNYDLFFDFAYTVANHNIHIFRYLMHRSKLIEHPVTKFYTTCVRTHLLETPTWTIVDEASRVKIRDPKIIDHAKQMNVVMNDLRQRLFLKYLLTLDSQEEAVKEALRKAIGQALVKFQEETGGPATLWDEKLVIEKYVERELTFFLSTSKGKVEATSSCNIQ